VTPTRFFEYQVPNNARLAGKLVAALEFSLELSSEVPGTSPHWPSHITVAINGKETVAWTSPGISTTSAASILGLVEAEGQPVR
jgi:predicted transcriptional regulator